MTVTEDKVSKKKKKKRRLQWPVPSVCDTSRQTVPPNKRTKTAKKKKKSSHMMSTSNHTIGASRLFAMISPARHCSGDLLHKEAETFCLPELPLVDVAREHTGDGMEVLDVAEEEQNKYEQEPVDERSSDRNASLQRHKRATFTPKADDTDNLFPFYTSVDTPPGISLLAGSTRDHSHCIMGYVPPPPSEAELAAVMQELEARRSVSPVDILTLIDGWESEKQLMEVNAGFESSNRESRVSCPKKSPQTDVSLSVRKTPKVSIATNSVQITAPGHVDSAAAVEARLAGNGSHSASKTSTKVDRQRQVDDSDDHFSTTERQPESNDVNDVVIARKNQDGGVESVSRDRSRNENDVLNDADTPESGHRRGRPVEEQMHRCLGFNTETFLSGEKRNTHSGSPGGIPPAKCPASHTDSEHDVDTCWDTNMDTSLDTSHLSFAQALASVVSPSPVGKIRMSSANLKCRARNLFRSPKGKMGGVANVSSGRGYEEPLVKGVRETEVGVETIGEGFGRVSIGHGVEGLCKTPAGSVSDLPASDVITRPTEVCVSPLKSTEVTPPRHDTASPTLFDSGDDDIDTVADGCNKARVNITSKTTNSADDPDVPDFSLLDEDDQCENTETGTEAAGADVVETSASATALDLPNFDLLDDDSFDELDFDLGFDMAESDEEVAPADGGGCHDDDADIPRAGGGATGVSPRCRHTAVSSVRVTVSPTELASSAVKPLTNSPVIVKSENRHYEAPAVIVRPTFVSGSWVTTSHPSTPNIAELDSSHYDLPNTRTRRVESVAGPSEMTTGPGLDDTVSLNRSWVKTTGSRLHLNLKQNHSVHFTEHSDTGRSMKQPRCKGRETEQPSDPVTSLHERFRGRTIEQPRCKGRETEQPSDPVTSLHERFRGRTIEQPRCKGRETEQPSDPVTSLHEERFRGRTIEQPGITGKKKEGAEPGLGGIFSEGPLADNKAIKSRRIRASNSATHGRHIDSVSGGDEWWSSRQMDGGDDFVQPQFGTTRVILFCPN